MAEMALERGLFIHPSCIWRWVQIYGPELDQRCRPHLKPCNKSYRVDETYIRVKGQDRYLYRAVDSTGQTIDWLLTAKRDAASAKRFFRKTLLDPSNLQPRVINVDKNRAYPTAVEELKAEGTLRRRCRLRLCKYLNNIVEQDHRVPKKRVRLARGYQSSLRPGGAGFTGPTAPNINNAKSRFPCLAVRGPYLTKWVGTSEMKLLCPLGFSRRGGPKNLGFSTRLGRLPRF